MSDDILDEPMQEINTGNVTINISETGLSYDTSFSLVETIFWLEALKTEILRNVFSMETGL